MPELPSPLSRPPQDPGSRQGDPSAAVAAWLGILPRVEPPEALAARILEALPAHPGSGLRWADDVPAPRLPEGAIRGLRAAAAALVVGLGVGGLLWAARDVAGRSATPSSGFRTARVIDDPALMAYHGSEGFDPLTPWSATALWGPAASGEPAGGP